MTKASRYRLEARAAAAVAALASVLPLRVVRAFGRGLGRLLGDLDRRHVAVATANLRQAFPHWDEVRRLRTAREVYAHFGQVLLEILWLHGRSREQVLPLVELEGRDNVEAAFAAGRGVLCVTAHIGNWEMHGLTHGWMFGPISVVARPLDNPDLHRRLCEVRTLGGNAVIDKRHALAQVVRGLKGNRGIAILIDQNVQAQDGIFVDFFGRAAATTTVAAALAVRTGCALLPSHTVLGRDGRYRLVYDPPLRWTASGDRQADIARLTQQLTSTIEGWIRDAPEQWLWLHKRWKTEPSLEPSAVGADDLAD
ncbi:MAG: lipid A biosynthesis acyltransferase [Acidobacteria bacterium]|nr:MAG: lipid A biosynthesis acyltransferase [Acidobacteriota bacterium]PYQ26136.1 MAG: lipid A biosynthesis acyltransferase [Acidobacteriota bacterium]